MSHVGPDTEELLNRSAAGDRTAGGQLLERHRKRLKRMVAIRLDRRLAPRVDPSDVVQERWPSRRRSTATAERPTAYYPWPRRKLALGAARQGSSPSHCRRRCRPRTAARPARASWRPELADLCYPEAPIRRNRRLGGSCGPAFGQFLTGCRLPTAKCWFSVFWNG